MSYIEFVGIEINYFFNAEVGRIILTPAEAILLVSFQGFDYQQIIYLLHPLYNSLPISLSPDVI